jgi:hypothetical protein
LTLFTLYSTCILSPVHSGPIMLADGFYSIKIGTRNSSKGGR